MPVHSREKKDANHEDMEVDFPDQDGSTTDEEDTVSSSVSEDGDSSGRKKQALMVHQYPIYMNSTCYLLVTRVGNESTVASPQCRGFLESCSVGVEVAAPRWCSNCESERCGGVFVTCSVCFSHTEMDDEDCERRRMECLDEMTTLEKQFTDLKEQ